MLQNVSTYAASARAHVSTPLSGLVPILIGPAHVRLVHDARRSKNVSTYVPASKLMCSIASGDLKDFNTRNTKIPSALWLAGLARGLVP